MKTILLGIIISAFSSQCFAQSQGPNNPAAAFDPAAACLACPGAGWMNPDSVYASDGNFSSVYLKDTSTVCFSWCYFTRYLFVEKFGFTLPLGATINGVEVGIEKKASAYGVVWDSLVYLVVNNNVVGNNKAQGAPWPITKNYSNYGGTTDLWGTTLTAADVNDTAFGIGIKARNSADTSSNYAYIDHIRMKVYYTPVGIQANAGNINFNAFYNAEGNTLNFKYTLIPQSSKIIADVYNVIGQLQSSYKLQSGNSGECMESIPAGGFSKGVYFVKVSGLSYEVVKKIIIQ